MSYKRTHNKHDLWLNYCQKHQDLILALKLDREIFRTEQNFRQFATSGLAISSQEI
jgi:hypothetical protein